MYEEKEIKYKKRKKVKEKKKKTSKFNLNYKSNVKTPKIQKPNFVNQINWKNLIIKLIILFLFMILIIFIISRINYNYKEKNKILNNNLNKIMEASLNFYTKEKLPHNIGDSTSLVLQEMIEKNLIPELKDKHNKNCNTANSYIILTKESSEDYRLKIFLTCEKEEKTVEKNLICTEKCQLKK